jgi:uncharacterized membrane protein YphA (DoxX/SURF4 family)
VLGRQLAIGFGIAIIFPLLVYYGVKTVHAPPVWQAAIEVTLSSEATAEEREARAQRQREWRQEYNKAAREFARVLIVVSTPLGIAAILLGSFLRSASTGTGFILGGIFTVAHGYWGYWNYADDWLRFVSLLLGLGVLLFVAYRLKAGAGIRTDAP